MKKLLVIMVAMLMTMNVFANVEMHKAEKNKTIIQPNNVNAEDLQNELGKINKKNKMSFQEKTQLLESVNVSFTYAGKTTPIAYDPYSNALLCTNYGRDEQNKWLGIYYITTDFGQTWDQVSFISTDNIVFTHPSIAIMNPTKSDKVEDLYISVHGVAYDISKPDDSQFQGGYVAMLTPEENLAAPDQAPLNNNQGQLWYQVKTTSFADENGVYSYYYGTLTRTNENQPYGYYGFGYIELTQFDQASSVPDAWTITNFKNDAQGALYNGPMNIVVDDNGNLYALLYNIFKVNEDYRLMGFSKSTDHGKTWSDFEVMPYSIQEDFLYEQGGNPEVGFTPSYNQIPYQSNGAICYGENDFSLILRLVPNNGNGDGNPRYPQIVEARYNNGTWSMDKIADWGGYWLDGFSSHVEGTDTLDYYTARSRGNEIQVATTLNGDKIIKYIDIDEDTEEQKLSKDYNVYVLNLSTDVYSKVTLDTLWPNSIYFLYKKAGTNEWKKVRTNYNEMTFNKNTYMPEKVRSLTEVPVFSTSFNGIYTSSFRNRTTNYPYTDQLFLERITGESHSLNFEIINLETSDVSENIIESNSKVYPNPASETVKISYTLKQPSRVAIFLYDINGKPLGALQNQNMNAGTFETQFNVSQLTPGTYIYKIKTEGGIETGKFQVSK